MFDYLLSLFYDRRNPHSDACTCCEHNRRRISLKEANDRLNAATKDFSDTITLAPDKVQMLLERVERRKARR